MRQHLDVTFHLIAFAETDYWDESLALFHGENVSICFTIGLLYKNAWVNSIHISVEGQYEELASFLLLHICIILEKTDL